MGFSNREEYHDQAQGTGGVFCHLEIFQNETDLTFISDLILLYFKIHVFLSLCHLKSFFMLVFGNTDLEDEI